MVCGESAGMPLLAAADGEGAEGAEGPAVGKDSTASLREGDANSQKVEVLRWLAALRDTWRQVAAVLAAPSFFILVAHVSAELCGKGVNRVGASLETLSWHILTAMCSCSASAHHRTPGSSIQQ